MLRTALRRRANRLLQRVNLELGTLTRTRTEGARLERLDRAGHFERPVLPVPAALAEHDASFATAALLRHESELARLVHPHLNDVGFALDNPYFGSPDAEVLYSMVRELAPGRIVEVGSGNSTRVIRQAVLDGGLSTRCTAIDPVPRTAVAHLVDEWQALPVEDVPIRILTSLSSGDVLFIDSSHQVRIGNDVVHLFLDVLPRLAPGVVVHVHDVFLPYDYPRAWALEGRRDWTEQYLLQALLQGSIEWEVLWPGHFIQRSGCARAEISHLIARGVATSFWMRRRGAP